MSPEEPTAPPATAPAAEEPIGGPVALRLERPRQPLLAAVLVELRDGALVFAPPLCVDPPVLPPDDPHGAPGAAVAARLLDSAGRILHPFRSTPVQAGDALPGTPEADAFARAHAARTRWSAAWDDALDAVRAELGSHVASLEWPAALRRPDLVLVAGASHPLPLRVVVAIGPSRSGWEAETPPSVRVEIQDADGIPLAPAYLPAAAEADADALVAGPVGRAFRSLIELHGPLEAAARAARASADPQDAPARTGRSPRPRNTTPALRFRSAGEVADGLGFALLAAVLAGSVSRSGALAVLLLPLPAWAAVLLRVLVCIPAASAAAAAVCCWLRAYEPPAARAARSPEPPATASAASDSTSAC